MRLKSHIIVIGGRRTEGIGQRFFLAAGGQSVFVKGSGTGQKGSLADRVDETGLGLIGRRFGFDIK